MKKAILGLATTLTIAASSAFSADTAIVVINSDYHSLPDTRSFRPFLNARDIFKRAGFQVFFGTNQSYGDMASRVREAEKALKPGDQLVVLLAGHFATLQGDSFLLSPAVRATDRHLVGSQGLAVNSLLSLASEHPGQAIVALAFDPDVNFPTSKGITQIPQANPVPEGVTLVKGNAKTIGQFFDLTITGKRVMDVDIAADASGVEASGFLPGAPFGSTSTTVSEAEKELWAFAQEIDSPDAYQIYLNRYPEGAFSQDAKTRLADLQESPVERAARIEKELGLIRPQRRKIQDDLTVLGYDTRGIDGVFGRGTRRAIAAWQRDNGFPDTGYLTRDSWQAITDLAIPARAEKERLEAEKEANRLEADRAYWRETGRGRSEAGLRAYLKRYPEGIYAEIARERLIAFEPPKPVGPAPAIIARDRAEERKVAGNPIAGLLVERAIRNAGFNPGRIDGVFDDKTRVAIKAFQESEGLPPTGFVGRQTFNRLLASQ